MHEDINICGDDYPTKASLVKIAKWPSDDPDGWFDFIESVWGYMGHAWKEDHIVDEVTGNEKTIFWISTCGWRGNEAIIKAMEKNKRLWSAHWVKTRRGGHYIFEVNKEIP